MNRLRILMAALSILVTVHQALPAVGHEPVDEPGHSLVAALMIGCVAVAAEATRRAGRPAPLLARRVTGRVVAEGLRHTAWPRVATHGIAWPRGPSVACLCVIRR